MSRLDREIGPREAEIARLTQELEPLTAVRTLFLQLLESSPPDLFTLMDIHTQSASAEELPPASESGYSRRVQIPEDIDLTGLEAVAGLDDDHDLREWLVLIAKAAPDKLLNTTQVGRALQRLTFTTSNLHSLRVSIQRTFDGYPESFKRVRAATYRYTGYPGTDLAQDEARPVPNDGGQEVGA